MSRRRQPCFIATQDALISSGVQPDRHGLKQGLWESSAGVYFADGKVRRKRQQALAFNIPGGKPIRGIGQLHASDGQRWLWAGAGGSIYRWEFGSPESILTGYGTYRADQSVLLQPTIYDFTAYGDWMIVNDGIAPRIYKPGSPATFDAWAGEVPQAVVKYMKVMNFMLAVGYSTRGTRVGWSDADDIDTWTPAANNLAGSLTVDDFDTPIRTAAKLGTKIAVYGEDQMSFVRYIGGTNVFGFTPGLDGIGAIGKAAVASDTKLNVGFGLQGAWRTDGNSFDYIDQGLIGDYFRENVNWDQAGKIIVGRNDFTGLFEFHFPVAGSTELNEGWGWDPASGTWQKLPAVSSAFDERRMFRFPLAGTVGGDVKLSDYAYDLSAQPLALSTKPLMLTAEDGSNRGTHIISHVDELELWLQESLHVQVRVGCADDPEGSWEWGTWHDCDANGTSRIIELDLLPENPLWKIQFQSAPGHDTDWRFNLQGMLLYGPDTGTKYER